LQEEKKERYMKLTNLGVLAIGASFLFASGAFAANEAKGKLRLVEPVTIEGKQVKAGEYNVQSEGTGAEVKLVISKGREAIATVPVHQVDEKSSHVADGYGSREEADGTRTLTSIFISGKKYDLQAAQNQAEQTPAGATAGNK
jgi:hypothetical protein